jgi:glycosyltransferase involved in cell wall biosynthesis
MEIKGIRYVGPLFDGSGYGQAARGYLLALHKAGMPITLRAVSFEREVPDLGATGALLNSLVDKDIDYNVEIIHLTPEHWSNLNLVPSVPKDVFKVGYSVWETSKLHHDWPGYINEGADAVFVGSEWSIDVYKESGVTLPIKCLPHGIDPTEFDEVDPYEVKGVKPSAFKFYNVFQFTERKNPMSLITSYWHAFQEGEDVALILKTYRMNYEDSEKEAVRETIKRLIDVAPMTNRPPIYLVSDMLLRNQVLGLHKYGDCLVSLDRGEGFGLAGFEAGAAGKPIIVTNWGGATEYAKDDNSYPVNYTLTPVRGMPWSPWYRAEQLWAEPDCAHAIELMRHVYNNREEAADKGKALQEYIFTNFNWTAIADRMVEGIKDLWKEKQAGH